MVTTTYDVDTEKVWFDVTAASAEIPETDTSPWDIPSSGEATKVSSLIKVDTAAADPLKYTPATVDATATKVRIVGRMENIVLNASVPDKYTGTLPQAALVAVDGDTDDYWYGWHCTEADDGAWVQLSGATPVEGDSGDYDVVIEFTKVSTQNKVRYGIGATPVWLTCEGTTDENGWMNSSKAFTAMTAIGLAGYGSFGDFGGLVVKSVTIDTTSEALAAAIEANRYSEADLATNEPQVANGLTPQEAVLLGLPTQSEKPVPAPVQTGDDFLGFTISNAKLDRYGTSAFVTLEVYEVDSPDAVISEGTKPTASGAADSTVKVSPDDKRVRYYKTKIKFN